MHEFSEPFKLDKNNLWYIDAKDVELTRKTFGEVGKRPEYKSSFYLIDGIDDYIIKDSTKYMKLFRKMKTLSMLKAFMKIEDNLPNVDFPVGYFANCGKVDGTVIPYYKDSISLRSFIWFSKFNELKKYYNKASDDIDNLICLLLDMLNIISGLYDNKVMYLDIHPGNFLLYNNDVKLIDFEPNYIYLKQKTGFYYNRILHNYSIMVHTICRRLEFKDVMYQSGESFMDAENSVKYLRKCLERKNGI